LAVPVQALVDALVGARELERAVADLEVVARGQPLVVGLLRVADDSRAQCSECGSRAAMRFAARVDRTLAARIVDRLRERDSRDLLFLQHERNGLVGDARKRRAGELLERRVHGIQQIAGGKLERATAVGAAVARRQIEHWTETRTRGVEL